MCEQSITTTSSDTVCGNVTGKVKVACVDTALLRHYQILCVAMSQVRLR